MEKNILFQLEMKSFISERVNNMKKSIYFFSFLLIVLSSCKTTPRYVQPVIQGMIYDGDNEAVSDVEIYFNDKKYAVSDIYGHFTLSSLTMGKSYTLYACKNGYEKLSISFTYTNPSQVIYLRMYSASELTKSAENMVEKKKYRDALSFLERAEASGGSYLSINYLRAVISMLNSDYDNALKIANEILSSGYIDSYVYLLIADIYKNGYSDTEKEQIYLKKSLELSYDPVVQERLNNK